MVREDDSDLEKSKGVAMDGGDTMDAPEGWPGGDGGIATMVGGHVKVEKM